MKQTNSKPSTQSASPDDSLREAVEAMVSMLEAEKWAEYVGSATVTGDPLTQRLADAITQLRRRALSADRMEGARDPSPLSGYLITEQGGQFVDFVMPEDLEGLAAYWDADGVTVTEVVERKLFKCMEAI